MRRLFQYTMRLDTQIILVSVLMISIIILSSPSKLYASNVVDFYSPNSPPAGVKSLEPLIATWWNWRTALPANTANNWPECLKGDGGKVGNNQSLVFVGDPVAAVESNANARNQKCEISAGQLLYLTVYAGECSTIFGSNPPAGEFPDIKSVEGLLKCAQDANKVIKKMQVKVDGKDVSSHIVRQTTSQPFKYIIPQVNAFDSKGSVVGGNNTSMAENYYVLFKPLPVGDHTIELEVIRQPLQANQPVEHDVAKWNIKVVQ
jgi:hypothetical protein